MLLNFYKISCHRYDKNVKLSLAISRFSYQLQPHLHLEIYSKKRQQNCPFRSEKKHLLLKYLPRAVPWVNTIH